MERVIELTYSVDTDRPCHYLSNKTTNILTNIKEEFEKKCFNNKYVLEVLEIIKTSFPRAQVANDSGKVTVNVIFSAKVLVFPPELILPDATIHISNSQILASTDTLYISLLKDTTNKILMNGQRAPIIIEDTVKYNTGNQANAIGHLFLPSVFNKNKVYKITGELNEKTFNALQPYIKLLEKQEPELSSIKKDVSELFALCDKSKLEEKGVDIVKLAKSQNTVDVTGYWFKNINNKMESSLYIKAFRPTTETTNVVELNVVDTFREILWHIYNMRVLVIGVSQYSPEDKQKSDNIWKLIERNKTR